jgi:hypothetical protein
MGYSQSTLCPPRPSTQRAREFRRQGPVPSGSRLHSQATAMLRDMALVLHYTQCVKEAIARDSRVLVTA